MSESLTQAPEGLLNYDNCSLKELRAFIEDRTGAAANEREILAAHLRKMDQTRTFPRFMELPPELRVNIYEALLVEVLPDEDMRAMFTWFAHPPAYQADIAACRELVPDLHSFRDWLAEQR